MQACIVAKIKKKKKNRFYVWDWIATRLKPLAMTEKTPKVKKWILNQHATGGRILEIKMGLCFGVQGRILERM